MKRHMGLGPRMIWRVFERMGEPFRRLSVLTGGYEIPPNGRTRGAGNV